MPKQIWVVMVAVLVISVCAFGDTTVATQWETTPGAGEALNYNSTTGYALQTGTGFGSATGGIEVSSVEGLDGALSASTSAYTIDDGLLTFQTAAGTADNWSWGGGSLEIKGCIVGITGTGAGGACQATDDSTVLVSDDFQSVIIDPSVKVGSLTSPGAVFGDVQGTINAQLAAFLGISTVFTSPASVVDIPLTDSGTGKLPATSGTSFSNVTTAAPGGEVQLVAAEEWSFSSTLMVFGFALGIFGLAHRFNLTKSVVS